MGHILHDWDPDQKRLLLQKAYAALPKNGRSSFTMRSSMTTDARTQGQIAAPGWPAGASPRATSNTLIGPDSMVVGIK